MNNKIVPFFFLALVAYGFLLFPLTRYMGNRTVLEKSGYVPQPFILRSISADQKNFMAVVLVCKVLFRSGGMEKKSNSPEDEFEYENIFNLLKGATRLDPYNMDGYYLTQAMAWDTKNVQKINKLLKYGMQYRSWDWYLPFFAGFNSFYFLKDYPHAAEYFTRAQELSGSSLFGRLASRYMYEGGATKLAITYLQSMIQGSKNRQIKEGYEMRLRAFTEVQRIEEAIEKYTEDKGQPPPDLQTLLTAGYLFTLPVDPYGGTFYLDEQGKPRTTSKFASHAQRDK